MTSIDLSVILACVVCSPMTGGWHWQLTSYTHHVFVISSLKSVLLMLMWCGCYRGCTVVMRRAVISTVFMSVVDLTTEVVTATVTSCRVSVFLLISALSYSVSGKKRDQNVFVWHLQNSGNSDEIWNTVSQMNLLQNNVNIFHVIWIMSLHYLVKLEMLIAHVLPLTCYRKKLQNLSHLICSL